LPPPSQTAWSFEFRPPLVDGEQPLFQEGCRGPVCLQMGGVDDYPLWLRSVAGKRGENPVKHAKPAPADEAVVKCLVWAIVARRILPLQAIADHIDDATVAKPLAALCLR
jgi:hypothetical protein